MTRDKFDEDARPKNTMSKETSSSKEDFDLFYEKDLGVKYLNNEDNNYGHHIRRGRNAGS
jgi:hypothetical protein